MRRSGTFFIVAGVIMLTFHGVRAPQAPNISYMIGTLTPGMACLIYGLVKRQRSIKSEQEAEEHDPEA